MYDPNVFTLNLEQLLSGAPLGESPCLASRLDASRLPFSLSSFRHLLLTPSVSSSLTDAAIGVLQLTISSARGIKATKIGGGTPDPYCSISLAGKAEVAKTKYKTSTYNPQWNEVSRFFLSRPLETADPSILPEQTKFILVNSLTDVLSLALYDYNEHRKDTELGVANFDLNKLKEDSEQEGLNIKILKEGKERGELRFDA